MSTQSIQVELVTLAGRTIRGCTACNACIESRDAGPITVARRAGHNFTFAQLLMWYMINDMIVPGSSYWNVATARDVGAVMQDTEALDTIDRFADNLAWLAKSIVTH